MAINVNAPILDLEGNQLDNLTFRSLAITALIGADANDSSVSAEDKLARFELAKNIKACTEETLNLSLEDRALLKKLCGRVFTTLAYGRMCEILEA